MVEDVDLQPAVAAEFKALAGALIRVAPEDWDEPSLCRGWRVREVVAHMTMAARYAEDYFMTKLRDYHFDFQKLSDDIAAEDAGLPRRDLISCLRSGVMAHWTPPGGGHRGALNHVVVHGLDATVALGLGHVGPEHNLRLVLELLTYGGVSDDFGTDIGGRRFEATDLDWSYGDGPVLSGSAADLVLTMCRRDVGDRMTGEPL